MDLYDRPGAEIIPLPDRNPQAGSHESGQHIHPRQRPDSEGAPCDDCGEVLDESEHLNLPCCYNVLIRSAFVPVQFVTYGDNGDWLDWLASR